MKINKILSILFISFLMLSSYCLAMEKATDYKLDVTFIPESSSMKANAVIKFADGLAEGIKVFYLHGELEVSSIKIAGEEVKFQQAPVVYAYEYSLIAKQVTFTIEKPLPSAELRIEYAGFFHPSASRSASDYMRIDDDGVFLRAFQYSLWFPIFLEDKTDSYATNFSDVTLSVPEGFKTVFVGEKISETIKDGQNITKWRVSGINLIHLQVTAQRYKVLERENVHIYFYDNEKSQTAAEQIALLVRQLVKYNSKYLKKNAKTDSLFILEMPEYGNISAHNMVGLTSDVFQNINSEEYPKRTLAHELVHPFVSVKVSRDDPLFCLAIEGFPSYFHLLGLRHFSGKEKYNEFMVRVEKWFFKQKESGVDHRGNKLPVEKPFMKMSADDYSTYKDGYILWGKTKLFFNYLLREMGEEKFLVFTSDLVNRDSIKEKEFVSLLEKYLPSKKEQIHTWLYTNDFPEEFKINAGK
ncbi:MAG: hypothetical protein JW737_07550 [Acidobacteria bacterium]|nr:hypothetical protein [Acidobacteriota bacterium]